MKTARFIIGTAAFAVIFAFALTGCSEATKLKAFVSRQAHAVLDPPEDEIPQPHVASEGKSIPTRQSTYCWGNRGCADYADGYTMLKDAPAAAVSAGARIDVSFAYKPAPAHMDVVQFFQDRPAVAVPLTDGRYDAPKAPGIYYYGVSAYWKTADGKYSAGDTSSVYAIQVR